MGNTKLRQLVQKACSIFFWKILVPYLMAACSSPVDNKEVVTIEIHPRESNRLIELAPNETLVFRLFSESDLETVEISCTKQNI